VADVQERWVHVTAFSNRVEAETARSALTARGIASRLVGDDAGGAGFPLSLEHQCMEAHVAADDLGTARHLLDLDNGPSHAHSVNWLVIGLVGAVFVAIGIAVALSAAG